MKIDFINFTPLLYALIELQENWTPAQNGRFDWVEGGDRDILLARSASKPHSPHHHTLAFASLGFPFACVNRVAVNSV